MSKSEFSYSIIARTISVILFTPHDHFLIPKYIYFFFSSFILFIDSL
jgi:hypothetical protein